MLTVDPTYYCVFVKMEEKLMQSQIFPWDKIAQHMS